MAIKYRRDFNRELTADEVDENFETVDLYKGTYTNLAALQAEYPSPNDADYAYSTDGTTRFYALNSTWQQEQLSVSYNAAAQYLTITDMTDAQSTQVDQDVYEVVDASSDPVVNSRDNFTAHYLYLGGTTGTLSDYQLQPQARNSVDAPFNDYGSLNEMFNSQDDQKKSYAYHVDNDSKIYIYNGRNTRTIADYAVLGVDLNKQTILTTSTVLNTNHNNATVFLNSNADITISIDHTKLSIAQSTVFFNKGAGLVTFTAVSGTTMLDIDGLTLEQNKIAALERLGATVEVFLKGELS